jgi:hypothetical protein
MMVGESASSGWRRKICSGRSQQPQLRQRTFGLAARQQSKAGSIFSRRTPEPRRPNMSRRASPRRCPQHCLGFLFFEEDLGWSAAVGDRAITGFFGSTWTCRSSRKRSTSGKLLHSFRASRLTCQDREIFHPWFNDGNSGAISRS